jgi:hypothetical protein
MKMQEQIAGAGFRVRFPAPGSCQLCLS